MFLSILSHVDIYIYIECRFKIFRKEQKESHNEKQHFLWIQAKAPDPCSFPVDLS